MCARRHVIVAGDMTTSWMLCNCPASSPGTNGHYMWVCHRCKEEGFSNEARLYPAGHDESRYHLPNPLDM